MEDHLELRYTLSFSELIHYPDQNSDGYLEKEEFERIREFLEIDIDEIQ